jgi:5-methylcytosine-specific restriction endonuclease McrA
MSKRKSRTSRARLVIPQRDYTPAKALLAKEQDEGLVEGKRYVPLRLLLALAEADKEWHTCPGCGDPTRRKRFCSAVCCNRYTSRQHEAAKRAARLGVEIGDLVVELIAVAERDGWVCHICRRKVDPKRKAPDPMAASIDHLIPLSKGGPDSMVNVALAHRRCNSARGAGRLPAQLRLLG